MKTFKKDSFRKMRIAKTLKASEAIGKIEKNTDTYILTFGQFSLIDAIISIIDQIGPCDVALSSWTAADAHLEKTAEMVEASEIRNFRMIVDRSFETRQPKYCEHMRRVFGVDCIRHVRSHAKFAVLTNDGYKIVIRTSMNLNENPRLENIEITENPEFAEFMLKVVDDIFAEVDPLEKRSRALKIESIQEEFPYKEVSATKIKRKSLNEPKVTHQITNTERDCEPIPA